MKHQEEQENGKLRAEFTRWMETTLYRAKINYLKSQEKSGRMMYLAEIPEEILVEEQPEKEWFHELMEADSFHFTEEKLEEAFRSLITSRQEILTMLFVEERTPKEIAFKLGCSKQYVYKQRAQALENIRKKLEQGGDGFEQ